MPPTKLARGGLNVNDYPVRYSVDYPERPLNRLTTVFRIFTVIPIAIVMAAISGFSASYGNAAGTTDDRVGGIGLLFLPAAADDPLPPEVPALVVRLESRAAAVQQPDRRLRRCCMDDRYPSTDEQQAVHLDSTIPTSQQRPRPRLPLVKWLLAIPHYVVLFFLYIGAFFAAIAAWFAILFTGRYPRGLFDFVEGVMRWHNRVVGYAFVLVTDRYPPFQLRP